MKKFKHSQKLLISKEEYVDLYGVFRTKTRKICIAIIFVVAVACLFTSYTLLLGIVLIGFIVLAMFRVKLLRVGADLRYDENLTLQVETTYTVDERGVIIKNKYLDTRSYWRNQFVFRETEKWLHIHPHGMNGAWFDLAKLKDAGVYDDVIAKCKRHGTRYNQKS